MRALAFLARLVRAGLALTILAGFTTAVPWLLTTTAGWPLTWLGWTHPDTLPSPTDLATAATSPWSDQAVLALLATGGWILWAQFVRDLTIEILLAAADAADLRAGRPSPATGRRGPLRWAAAILVGAILGTVLLDAARATLGTRTVSTAAGAAVHRPTVAVAAAKPTVAGAVAAVEGGAARAVTSRSAASTVPVVVTTHRARSGMPDWVRDAPGGAHHVVKGDTLWDIAEAKLGNPHRWREIYVLNRDQPQPNGYALHDPDLIHIGWWLALPDRDHVTKPQKPPASAAPRAGSQQPDKPEPPGTATPAPAPAIATPTMPASPGLTPGNGPAASTRPTTQTTPAPPSPPTGSSPATHKPAAERDEGGVVLPSQAWISLGLAATIATVAGLLRLQRRRHARLSVPIEVRTGPQPSPVPEALRLADAAGSRMLDPESDDNPLPDPPALPAPIGIGAAGDEISLFDLPGSGVALAGEGALPVARAVLAAVLSTGVTGYMPDRPLVITTAHTLAALLPPDMPPTGLDPGHQSFDGERLVVEDSTAAAVTAFEEEMIHRRRLLDSMDEQTMSALNARQDHVEHQPHLVLLVEADGRYAPRIAAVAHHRAALHLHPVLLGACEAIPAYRVTADGTLDTPSDTQQTGEATRAPVGGRLATLAARDLADMLDVLRQAAPRPETGVDIDDPFTDHETAHPAVASAGPVDLPEIPAPSGDAPAPVRLNVLGPPGLVTEAGPIGSGVRSGSLAVLAVLAAHPAGRTLEQLAEDLHPDAPPEAGTNRVHTDIVAARAVLREATGITGRGRFVVHDTTRGGRYRIDPDLIEVDLWRLLSAIDRANKADDDETALAALQEAAGLYGGEFAAGQDRAWVLDYATTFRHQILSVYGRIAELLEADQPDQAVAALEMAIELDPVNEELYQRLMRIHGRQHRPDAVRRTLGRLEDRLAEIGEAEPSEATRRVATRQLTRGGESSRFCEAVGIDHPALRQEHQRTGLGEVRSGADLRSAASGSAGSPCASNGDWAPITGRSASPAP